MKTHYETLGVGPGVEPAALRSAWLSLAARYHPDRNPKGAAKMAEINVAYTALSDKKTRAIYDLLNKLETRKCGKCQGRGEVKTSNFYKVKRAPCTVCGGTGWAVSK
jgi:DnaJ-class molecular chaperone